MKPGTALKANFSQKLLRTSRHPKTPLNLEPQLNVHKIATPTSLYDGVIPELILVHTRLPAEPMLCNAAARNAQP